MTRKEDIATALYDELLNEGILTSAYDTIDVSGTAIYFRQASGLAPPIKYSEGRLAIVVDDVVGEVLMDLNDVARKSLEAVSRLEHEGGLNGYRDRSKLLEPKRAQSRLARLVAAKIEPGKKKPTVVFYELGGKEKEGFKIKEVRAKLKY